MDVRKAIVHLEYVVRRNPQYKDSLTQLGRAYYYAGRYGSSLEVLKRALALNRKDEIGWIVLGLTQMQRGEDEAGLESFKGGLTLLAKATKDGYQEIPDEFWDARGVVRRALRRSISLARKGVVEKRRIIQSGELLLHRVDRELYDAEQDQSLSEYLDSRAGPEEGQLVTRLFSAKPRFPYPLMRASSETHCLPMTSISV